MGKGCRFKLYSFDAVTPMETLEHFVHDGVQRLKHTDSLWNGQDITFLTKKKLTSAVLVSFSWSMNTLWAHITESPGSAWSVTSPQENASKLLLCSPKQLNHFLNATLGLRNVAGLVSMPGNQKWFLSLSCPGVCPSLWKEKDPTQQALRHQRCSEHSLHCAVCEFLGFAGTQELIWQKQNYIWGSEFHMQLVLWEVQLLDLKLQSPNLKEFTVHADHKGTGSSLGYSDPERVMGSLWPNTWSSHHVSVKFVVQLFSYFEILKIQIC